jgi:hypothetical protein
MRPLHLVLLAVLATENLLQAQNIQMTSWSQLLADGGRVSWSVNNTIAYDHQGSPGPSGYFNVYTMTTSGGSQTCITCPSSPGASVLPGLQTGNPTWTPDGRFLLFQAQALPSQGSGALDFSGFPGEGWNNDVWATDTMGNFWQLTNQGRWGANGILTAAVVATGTDSGLPNAGTWTTTGGGGTGASGTFTASGGNLLTVSVTNGGAGGFGGSGYTSNPVLVPSSGSIGTSTVSFIGSGGVIYITISPDGTKLAWGQRLVPGGANENQSPGNWALAVAAFSESGGIPSISSTQYYTPGINKLYYEPHTFSLDSSTLFFMGNLDTGMNTYARNIYSFNLSTQVLFNLTKTLVNWNEYPTALPSVFGSNKITYMLYPQAGSINPNCTSDYWVMNYDGTGNYQLTFFNTPGGQYYNPSQPVCMDTHSWNPVGNQLVAFPNYFAANGHTGEPGPIWTLIIADVAVVNAVSSGAFPGSGFYPGSGLQ